MNSYTSSAAASAAPSAAPRVTSTVTHAGGQPACSRRPDVYLNPLVEEASVPARDRPRRDALLRQASELCLECPLMRTCLHRAVVQHDVSGFVAGTTEAQRRAIRRILGVQVESEDFSAWLGQQDAATRVNTEQVVRMRAAHPQDSLPDLAVRLGCSLSTVKRHLRAHREGTTVATDKEPPTIDEVMAAYRQVCGRTTSAA